MQFQNEPLISVVIPTRNRAHLWPSLFDALEKQELGTTLFEVIAVNDGSTDGTEGLLTNLQRAGSLNLTVLSVQPSGGPAKARNRGVRNARANIVAFTDDDCLPTPGWLKSILRAFRDTEAVGVEGPIVTDPRKIFASTHQVANSIPGAYWTANVSYLRSVLFQVGLFDEEFPFPHCEDRDLGLRVRAQGRIAFDEAAIVCHPPISIGLLAQARKVRYCLSNIRFYLKHDELQMSSTGVFIVDTALGPMINSAKSQLLAIDLVFSHPLKYASYVLYNLLRFMYILMLIPELRKEEIRQRRMLCKYK